MAHELIDTQGCRWPVVLFAPAGLTECSPQPSDVSKGREAEDSQVP